MFFKMDKQGNGVQIRLQNVFQVVKDPLDFSKFDSNMVRVGGGGRAASSGCRSHPRTRLRQHAASLTVHPRGL